MALNPDAPKSGAPVKFGVRLGYLGDETGGLDWLDVRGLNIPGIPDGQLHLVMIDNGKNQDDLYLKHYSF